MSRRPSSPPPRWLMVTLMTCLTALLLGYLTYPGLYQSSVWAVEATATPEPEVTPELTPTPLPTPSPTPAPTPTPEPVWGEPAPEGEAADPDEWFADAVFIGDSRTTGLRLFSGVTTKADFLDYTGLTAVGVAGGTRVISSGDQKISVLDALAKKDYGKVYLSLGLNELGDNPQGYAEAYAKVIDAVRECQSEALIYVHLIFPVNEAKCKANGTASSVNNTAIAAYNEALSSLCGEKQVFLIGVPDDLRDENGENPSDLTTDGLHYRKEGYELWLAYLAAHTGQTSQIIPTTQTGEPSAAPEDPSPSPDSSEPLSTVTPPAIGSNLDYSQAVPKGESADPETWFKDAVFIGDSRTDGFHMFSGVKGGTYLVHTGLTIFDVVNQKAVLGSGDNKYSVLSALKSKQYAKIYIALGVNELGWFDAQRYAEAFGKLIDSLRESQPDAAVYVQAIIPVNSAVCKSHSQPYYVTNDNISSYNDALAEVCTEKKTLFLNVSEALVDETGEPPADLTSDGVHFKKAGYQAWLDYLLCHTGEGETVEEIPEETPAPTPSPEPTPVPTPANGMPPAAPEATPVG